MDADLKRALIIFAAIAVIAFVLSATLGDGSGGRCDDIVGCYPEW